MGYYRLKESYVLRGWEKLPWALVRRPRNTVQFLSREEFDALSLCNDKCDCVRVGGGTGNGAVVEY